MSVRSSVCVVLTLAAMFLAGCDRSPPPPPASSSNASTQPSASDVAAIQDMLRAEQRSAAAGAPGAGGGQLPAGHPTLPPDGAAPPGAAPAGAPAAGDLKYEAPAAWKREQPRSAMRKAQFTIPKSEGDAEDGEMILFFFGKGQGGGVTDNLARWRGMMSDSEGKPVADSAVTQESFDVDGLKVTAIDVRGRYAPSAMAGAPATGPKDDYRMFAAVIETPGGPWFFRGTGPDKTMSANRDAFLAMLRTVKP